MNRRLLTILFVAFVIAAACTLIVVRMVGSKMSTPAHQVATTRVVAAAGDIKLGSVLALPNLTTMELAGMVPKGAILEKDQASLVGRGVLADMYAGEPIMENRLAAPGAGGGLAATIRQGMRACAVKVDDVVGVAGFVTPGMRVDVLISGVPPGQPSTTNDQGSQVKTLLQNIEVLSAGVNIEKSADGKAQPVQVVNLLVTPEQAEILSLASSQTHIQLVLRNPLDTKITATSGTVTANLFKDAPGTASKHPVAKVAKKPAPKSFSIEVISGSTRNEQKFSAPGDTK
jgi:pilus assembly protein CpaB